DCRREQRLLDRRSLRLDENTLPRGDLEPGAVEDLRRPARLAVRNLPILHLPRPYDVPEHYCEHGKGEPAERRCLPVRSAPATCPASEIRLRHGQPLSVASRHRP